MLSPEYLLRVSEGGEEIAESLHNDIISKIVERIAVRLDRGDDYILTAQDKWQIEVLQESGMLLEDIQKVLAQSTGLMQKEIAEAMEDAGVKALEYDDEIYKAAGLSPKALEQSPYLVRLMQRNYEATLGEWDNFTRTMATATQQSFIKACNNAYMQVASGAFSYSEAFVDAINAIVSDGVYVEYPSGHRDTIETATLRCIRTGVSQATAQITDARMDEMDWDIILVSSHLGARVTGDKDLTDHAWWQGKFYSKSGKDERFPPFSVCGQGHVQGIHGANCRHSHGPGDGEFNPYEKYDSEENRKAYETQQRQRTLERRIRDSKRKVMGLKEAVDKAGTPEGKAKAEAEYQKQAALLQKRNAAYNKFCEDNNLKKLNERITIAKWDRKQTAQARAASRKATGKKDIQHNIPKQKNSPKGKPKPQFEDVTESYFDRKQAQAEVLFDDGYDKNKHKIEIETTNIIATNFGGKLKLLTESLKEGEKTPDLLWNDKMWEIKNPSTEKAVDSALRSALKQIEKNPGGVILNFSDNEINIDDVVVKIKDRLGRKNDIIADVTIVRNGRIAKIIRKK